MTQAPVVVACVVDGELIRLLLLLLMMMMMLLLMMQLNHLLHS